MCLSIVTQNFESCSMHHRQFRTLKRSMDCPQAKAYTNEMLWPKLQAPAISFHGSGPWPSGSPYTFIESSALVTIPLKLSTLDKNFSRHFKILLETICMKCQKLFSGKNKKNINLSFA